MANWDIEIGETLLRRELHARWGGSWFGGMEPSVKAHSVFLFSNPSRGAEFGYNYDGWRFDSEFHYTGDGQVGDQSVDTGGNKAPLDAEALRRTIRLFRSEGTSTTYLGEFELADPPYYRASAPDRNGDVRSVVVFLLIPSGVVLRATDDQADPRTSLPAQEIPVEANNVERYVLQRSGEPAEAMRTEAELVRRYGEWLKGMGQGSTPMALT